MNDRELFDWDYDPERYQRMGQLLKKKRESSDDAGFFEIIENLFSVDYLGVAGQLIDRMLWSRIALRSPSPIVVHTHDQDEGERLTLNERTELARMMYSYYKVKWDKQKAVVAIEYDPIHNYLDEWSDTSEGEDSKSGTSSGSRTDTPNVLVTKSSTRTDNLLETETLNTTNQRTDDITKTTTFGKTETTTNDLEETKTYDIDETESYNNYKEETNYNSQDQRSDNLTETKDYGKTSTRTDNLTETKNYGKTSTRTDNLTETDSGDSGTKEMQIYAFNSTSYQPSEKEIHNNWGGNTRNNTGTQGTVDGGTDTTLDTGTQGTVEGGQDETTNTGTQTSTKSGKDWLTKSGAIERDKTGTETTEKDGTVGVVQGGTESVADTGTQTVTNTGTDSVANTGTQASQGTEATTGTTQRVESGTETVTGTSTRDRSGVHSGNIGNLTSQKQIGEEIALWKWNFIEEILSDATDFLTLQVYC